MRNARIEVKPVSGAVGAEIHGVDLSRDLEAAEVEGIRSAFVEHGVVFFRDQDLTPEQHIAFARRIAPININRFFKAAPGYPEIAEVRKEPDQKTNIGGGWHTDHSYDQIPAMGSILLAREVPPRGGDTMFACMSKAYEALSDGLKRTLEGMRAVHSSRHVFGEKALAARGTADRYVNADQATQDAVHPVVIRHPESGRKVLYVNGGFTTALRGLDAAGERAPAQISLCSRQQARVPDALPVATRLDRHVGQPRHLALRHQRLSRRPPPDAPHHAGRRAADGLGGVSRCARAGVKTCPIFPPFSRNLACCMRDK